MASPGSAGGPRSTSPRIDVVGLGPAGPALVTGQTRDLIADAEVVFLRTGRHPAAVEFPGARTFDHHYERCETFDEVYRAVVSDLIDAARCAPRGVPVVYAVPGSPVVAERTVALLRKHRDVVNGSVDVVVHPALSFLDLALTRLGVDPVETGLTVIDGESFAAQAAGQSGPLLVVQCWSNAVLSDIKLSLESPPSDGRGVTVPEPVTILHHLGLPDEQVCSVSWEDLDRTLTADHLTSLWIPRLTAPIGAELVRLDELVHILRLRCPWDRRQTHGSLARHLLEESYEVLEAIDVLSAIDAASATGPAAASATPSATASTAPATSTTSSTAPATAPATSSTTARTGEPREGTGGEEQGEGQRGGEGTGDEERAVAHLEEELGDLLFQVYFHSVLAAEEGRFTLADVARGVHDKLVARHPHVFGDVTVSTPEEVATNWEALKLAEKNRSSVTEGIPAALPSLALTAKLQRKALAVGMELPDIAEEAERVTSGLSELANGRRPGDGDADGDGDGEGGHPQDAAHVGELLFALVNIARSLGVDPETALRSRAARFRASVEERG